MYLPRALSLLGWSLIIPTLLGAPLPQDDVSSAASTSDASSDGVDSSSSGSCPPNTSCLPSGVGRWVSLAPIPTYRQEHRSIAINGQIYVFGGVLQALPNGTYPTTALNQKYNVANDSWTTAAPLPIALNHINAATINGKIYVLGGMAFQNNLWVAVRDCFSYDPSSNTWTSIGQVPAGRQAGSAAVGVRGNTIYLAGGITFTNLTNYADNTTSIFTSYNVVTQTWTNLPDMPAPRDHAGVGLVNGKLYVLGGRAFNAIGNNGNKATTFSYDLSSKVWNANLPPPPSAPRAGIASAIIGNLIYCIGGEGNPNSATGVFAENQAFDTSSNTWSSYTLMPVPRHGTSAVVINKRIYIPGGGITGGGNPTFHNDYYQAA